MRNRVRDRQLVSLTPFFGCGRRYDLGDETLRRFAENAGRLAARVQIDRATLRRPRFAGDAGGLERRRVGDRNVSINASEKCRMIARDLIEVLARG
jgi:hypothetical protein